jgi:hypothetical protein
MGWMCGTYGGEEEDKGVWWGNLMERNHLEDRDVDGNIVLK